MISGPRLDKEAFPSWANQKAAMVARLYGGRWQIIDGPELGHGGQGTVFRVKDITGEHQSEFALKRVPNATRHDRFRREIDAIKRLTDPATQRAHPNIISLIDHSALDDAGDSEKQFLVMPIARGGDLSEPGRLNLYTDSIDAVLLVAKQIASALQAAHAANIIHRDVKPKNILFTGNGHETWLSDFGICLIREAPRITETTEVVGPRAFMAPELEDGGIGRHAGGRRLFTRKGNLLHAVRWGDTAPRAPQ
jgi:serine/threonine protein kinase